VAITAPFRPSAINPAAWCAKRIRAGRGAKAKDDAQPNRLSGGATNTIHFTVYGVANGLYQGAG